MGYLAIGARSLIAVVFLVSATSKVVRKGAFDEFAASVRGLWPLRPRLLRPVASAVVVCEFGTFVSLVVPLPLVGAAGFAIAMVLLVIFTVVIVRALGSGYRAPCRCFGASTNPLGIRHAARNVALIAAAALGTVAELRTGPVQLGGVVVAALAGLVLGSIVVVFDDILGLFQPTSASAGTTRPSEMKERARNR